MEEQQLDPRIVHQILLTEPSEFETMMTHTRAPTLNFEDFLRIKEDDSVEIIMKRAYRDHLLEDIKQEEDNKKKILQRLVLELHAAIRNLVPNRTDLHSILRDDENATTATAMISWIINAAQALLELESEARTEETKSWIQTANNALLSSDQKEEESSSSFFLVSSVLYLLEKTAQCQQEKEYFYLSQIVAPQLHTNQVGMTLERSTFRQNFGISPKNTRQWIRRSLRQSRSCPILETTSEVEERQNWIRRRWIHDILFLQQEQQEHQESILPEVFVMDVTTIKVIRDTTRMAVAGCSLGLLACQTIQQNPTQLFLTSNNTNTAGLKQVMKMKPKQRITDQKTHLLVYEQSIEDTLLNLAQTWKKEELTPEEAETLRGQTKSVLRGDNPVIQIMDDRMRTIFAELVVQQPQLPILMTTGRQRQQRQDEPDAFLLRAERLFQERGLAFFAKELAQASKLATKIVNLAIDLYTEEFLDQLLVEEFNHYSLEMNNNNSNNK